mmetsp:Transcript_75042/g.160770  ORF Transcript_75042/g.160770 Transcript_75042/m.160770 type:complete len:556 (-) Transcript_75042:62-1729(-)
MADIAYCCLVATALLSSVVDGLPTAPSWSGSRWRTAAQRTAVAERLVTANAPSQWDTSTWLNQWYPVGWADDFEDDVLTKVTLFDTDYCITRRSRGLSPVAMRDACPHRLASLSEGRVTSTGMVQCAYHGWAFDGETGACVDVPQAPQAAARAVGSSSGCGAGAVPCAVAGEMLWILPGGAAAFAAGTPHAPRPPPELRDGSGYRVASKGVRDLPVDFTLLLENIVDYDHGPFAHQVAGFDMYSGSSDHPQRVREFEPNEEDAPGSHPWMVQMQTDPVPKMTARVGTARKLPTHDKRGAPLTATSTFTAPCGLTTGRRTEDGTTSFLTFFFCVPTGVGRTRFIAGSSAGPGSKMPKIPRVFTNIFLNRFLDEDSHLLATQQPHVLAAEFAAKAEGRLFERAKLYRHRSPGEKLLIGLCRFLNAAVPSVPGRYALLPPGASAEGAAAVAQRAFACPPRSVTLDRFVQHTAIVPASWRLHRNLGVASRLLLGLAAAFAAMAFSKVAARHAILPAASAIFTAGTAYGCTALRRQFGFVKTAADRDADLVGIPKVYPDV